MKEAALAPDRDDDARWRRPSLLGVDGRINEEYVANYFVRSASEEVSAFASVDVVPAGHTLVVVDGRPSRQRDWTTDRFDIDPTLSAHDAVEEFRTLFAEAVRRRLDPGGAVWSELSGGLDTSAVVAMSSWLHRCGAVESDLSGTITYADSLGSGDESEFVDAVLHACGVRNHQVRDSWPWRDDGHGPMHTEIPGPCTLFWFRDRWRNHILQRAGAEVLLSGFGGDHLLEGNLHFFADWLAAGAIGRTSREMVHWAALQQRSFWQFALHTRSCPSCRRLDPASSHARATGASRRG